MARNCWVAATGWCAVVLVGAQAPAQTHLVLDVPELTRQEIAQGNARVYDATFTPDGHRLWLGRNQQLFVFETRYGKLVDQINFGLKPKQQVGLISRLWFVLNGRYLLIKTVGNSKPDNWCLLSISGNDRARNWFDPSGRDARSMFAGQLESGELVFLCGESDRQVEDPRQTWTVVDPSAVPVKSQPIRCEDSIGYVRLEASATDTSLRFYLPTDAGADVGVHLLALQSRRTLSTKDSTLARPCQLVRDGDRLVPRLGSTWSFRGLPLAVHLLGRQAVSRQNLSDRKIALHAHTDQGRQARVGVQGVITVASGRSVGWHGDFLAAHDVPDGTAKRAVQTSVRVASFGSEAPLRRLATGKGLSASVLAVSKDGSRVLTQTVLKEPPVQHSRWLLWTTNPNP